MGASRNPHADRSLSRRELLAALAVLSPFLLNGCSPTAGDDPQTPDSARRPAERRDILMVASDVERVSGDAVWCAPMQICWDNLRDLLNSGLPIEPLGEGNAQVNALNEGSFDASMVSDDHYYAYSGKMDVEARATIEQAISDRFGQTSDILDRLDWDAVESDPATYLLYAMLYRAFTFEIPFGVLGGGW